MNRFRLSLSAPAATTLLALGACSTSAPRGNTAPAAAPPTAAVRTPAPGSKFAALKVGMDMDMDQVQQVIGRAPDRSHSYETGKRWIPFYFATDARRLEALYKGEGCLVFTGGNVWGAAGGELIEINADTTGACYDN